MFVDYSVDLAELKEVTKQESMGSTSMDSLTSEQLGLLQQSTHTTTLQQHNVPLEGGVKPSLLKSSAPTAEWQEQTQYDRPLQE